MKPTFILTILLLGLSSYEQILYCALTVHSDMPGKQLVDGQINVQYTDHISMYVNPLDTVYFSDIQLIGAPKWLEVHYSQLLSSSDTYFFVFTGTPLESGDFTFQISYNSNVLREGYECSKTKISEDIYLNIQP